MISFILPAHNESQLIAATLASLRDAADALQQPFEIIVVDDASDDGTAGIATAHGARVVTVGHRHIAAARNAGAGAASGEVFVFVDADTLVDAPVVSAAISLLAGGAVGGGATVRLLGPLAWYERWVVATFVWLLRIGRVAPGCFQFCTRAAFEATGGFDERLYAGEDVAMSRALARQGRFVLLRESVHTSERKLRTYPLAAHLRLLLRFAWRGRRMLTSRDALELWYGQRRGGPH